MKIRELGAVSAPPPLLLAALVALGAGLHLTARGQAVTSLPPAATPAGASMSTRPAAPLTLEQALKAAAENFDVVAARANLDAAQGDVLAADRAPLPVLSAKAGQIDLQNGIGAGNPLTGKRIDKSLGIDWTWERGNKREKRVATAQALVGAAQADLLDIGLQQQILTVNAYFDLLAAQQRQTQVGELAKSADALVEVMRKRLKAGDIAAQELARAEIEASKARLEAATVQLDRQRAALALAQLIRRTPDGLQLDEQAWPVLARSATDDAVGDEARGAALTSEALERRPDVQAADRRVQAAVAAFDSAVAHRQSDVTWGVSMDHYPGTSTRMAELRVQMPLQIAYQQQGEIRRARAQADAAQELAAKTRALAAADLNRLWQEARAAALAHRTQEEDLLPRARQVLAQAELAYSKGALSLTDLFEARRTLRTSLLDAITARAAYAKALRAWQLRTTG